MLMTDIVVGRENVTSRGTQKPWKGGAKTNVAKSFPVGGKPDRVAKAKGEKKKKKKTGGQGGKGEWGREIYSFQGGNNGGKRTEREQKGDLQRVKSTERAP